ncbi:MAG: BACON domain-containing protein [Bacteroidales bacterium]|nr:BACON domain-containing protein [Bacteroidales bacterium]
MKKFLWYTLAALLTVSALSSCHKDPEVEPVDPSNVVTTVTASNLLDAAAAAYETWEEDTTIPTTLQVGSGASALTLPQYQYAIAKLLVNLAGGDKSDVQVLGYKAADHPERDSYDQKEIAVKNGPKITEGTEDLVDIAKRMLAAMEDKLTVPNQTVITRTGASALAFSTNRATVTILRALAAYKNSGSFPASVSTEYLSAAASLKGFAQQFVGILDIWEKTVGTVSADGSHCTDNNSAWKDVHFVPIPHSGGAYADGVDQYDAKYQPYFTVTIDGKEYTSAQTWGIALRGIVDMITVEGSAKKQENRNPFEHTMGNGASLKEPIPAVTENDIWGQYPWYESTNDGPAINQSQFTPYLIARCATWFLTRQEALGKIGNYQFFCSDPDEGFVEEGVDGFVSSMRMWLIAARFYKYLLDNNITENVYDAVKDVTFATDLYGVEMPDIELKTKSVALDAEGKAVSATFMAKKEWTATATESWIHVDPVSGDASSAATVSISADPNTGDERTGTVVISGGNVTEGLEIAVTQAKYVDPSSVSLKDFAQEFVKGLDVWAATVGTVESENKHLIEKGTAWVNVHFIPVGKTGGEYDNHPGNQHDDMYTPWTLNVNGTEYTSAQAWEIATRGLLDMVLTDGQDYIGKMTSRNKPGYTLGDYKAFSEIMTATPSQYAIWGQYPWYEEDGVTYNGAPVEEVGINLITKATLGHLVRGLVGIPGVFDPLGKIGNFQEFGDSDSSLMLEGYSGLISPMRELILLMRFYKYLLDNNIDQNVYSAIKDVQFDYDMYAQDVAPTPDPTIADFAQEFAKVADKWDTNVGTVSYTREGTTYQYDNVHFVPENFVITLNGTNYDKFQMHEIGMRALKALENGAAMTDPIEKPGSYEPATSPYHEYDDPLQEKVAKLDLLSNFATRCLNYLKNNGEWPNVCGYPRTSDPVLTNYNGYVCVERDLLMLSRLYRYMVKNNITSLDAVKDVEIDTELWGDAAPASATIKEFAQEYVKILDIWQKTTGEIVMHPDVPEETVANAHYVPENTTITVGGKTYNTADMWETALRSYLLIRGYDGLETEKYGKNSIPALEGGAVAMSTTPVPATHGYYWGSAPFNETKGNGGHLVMGSDENGEHCKVKVDILDNWAMRSLNFQHGQSITNLCGYAGGQLAGYYGCFSSQRALLTYAFFFKYMLDNNLDKGTQVSDDTIIRSELLGDEGGQPTLKDFAKEFVKGLDVWQNTVGTVESEGKHLIEKGTAWENAHFIPITPNPNCEYLDHEGNQYDPKYTPWVMTVAGQQITSSEAWEIAIRGLMNMVTAEGEDFLPTMDNRNKAYTLANNANFATAPIPSASEGNKWGKHPWYEADDNYNGLTYNGGPVTEVDVNFMVKVGAWHVVRSFVKTSGNSPLGMIGNFQQFGTGSSTLNLEGYEGYIAPMRELLILMRIYKDLLDNNVEANVYDALKSKKFSYDLYGIQ